MRTRTFARARRRGLRRAFVVLSGAAVAVGYFAMSSLPAFSAEAGTVNAQVTVVGPCITVPTEPIDFDQRSFSSPAEAVTHAEGIGYTSCSAGLQKVFAKGTAATGPTATWTLATVTNPCVAGVNAYKLNLYAAGSLLTTLSGVDQELESLGAGLTGKVNLIELSMPCQGSDGGGQTMSFQIQFTATS